MAEYIGQGSPVVQIDLTLTDCSQLADIFSLQKGYKVCITLHADETYPNRCAARYVGTLHEISSENSTVALENVVSFGTEDRRPDEMVPASDNVYEYIVFRGSDVKDLRIEEAAPPKENKPPQVPDDPAILGVSGQSQTKYTCRAPLPTLSMMKHIGCKNITKPPRAQKPCGYFRCLPSDVLSHKNFITSFISEVSELIILMTERPPTGVFEYASYSPSSSTSEAGTFPRTTSDAATTARAAGSTF